MDQMTLCKEKRVIHSDERTDLVPLKSTELFTFFKVIVLVLWAATLPIWFTLTATLFPATADNYI